jgi:chromosome segregation ATPase
MLLELLPHFARLMPVADKYLNSRSESDKAHEAALGALATEVRGGLAQVTEEHAGLRRQLQEQSAQVAELAVDATRARMVVENVEPRIEKLEKTVGMAVTLLWGTVALLVGVAVLVVVILVKLRAH